MRESLRLDPIDLDLPQTGVQVVGGAQFTSGSRCSTVINKADATKLWDLGGVRVLPTILALIVGLTQVGDLLRVRKIRTPPDRAFRQIVHKSFIPFVAYESSSRRCLNSASD